MIVRPDPPPPCGYTTAPGEFCRRDAGHVGDHLDALLARIEAGDPLPIPESLRADVEAAVRAGRPVDVAAWAERLAADVAAATEDG